MLHFFRTLKERVGKERDAAKEKYTPHDYMQVSTASVQERPFAHIVIDNIFKEDINKKILKHFNEVLARGLSQEDDDKTKFHRFPEGRVKPRYEGYLYTPLLREDPVLDLFFSMRWNLFFSNLFKQHTERCTSVAYHYHPAGNPTGVVHNDYGSRPIAPKEQLSNKTTFGEHDKGYDDMQTAPVCEGVRAIGLLYYLGDEVWQDGEGGETGLYASKTGSLVKRVAPHNNRLFAFQTSPESFHAFQQNARPRSCIVQWLHSPSWYKK